MLLRETEHRRFRWRLWMLPAGFLLLFTVFFARQIYAVLFLIFNIFYTALGGKPFPLPPDLIQSTLIILFNCLGGFFLVAIIWLGLVSAQALLPITSSYEFWDDLRQFEPFRRVQEVYRTAFHLFLHIIRRHGMAVFVRDGQIIAAAEELDREGAGVVVVDYNSAVVLEEGVPPPSLIRVFWRIIEIILIMLGLRDRYESPRVRGAGITFTRPRERIRAVVDLRPQFRVRKSVSAYTRDGIELTANVWVLFAVGQRPEYTALHIAYVDGGRRAEDLRVVTLEPVAGTNRLRVSGFADTLDDADRREVHRYARAMTRLQDYRPYTPLPERPPYPDFIWSRVFEAVFAQARSGNQQLLPWTELPTLVASEFFRQIVSQHNFDEFFQHDLAPGRNRQRLRQELATFMRNNGVLCYRLLIHRENQPLQAGREYEEAELLVSPFQMMNTPKVLRERGILVSASGFSEISPVSPLIEQQHLETWAAPWRREEDIEIGEGELDALRLQGQWTAAMQEDLFNALVETYQDTHLSQEALAIRVLQALEKAAADPQTRVLLPENALNIMRDLHNWLLPGESGMTGRRREG